MGYRTNLIAKSLQRNRFRIGFIINERVKGFNDRVFDGAKYAEKELADFNVEGRFKMVPQIDVGNNIKAAIYEMVDEGIDGIVFVPTMKGEYDEIISELSNKGIAVGTVIRQYSHPGIAFSVYPDRESAGAIAADLFHMSGIAPGAEVLIMIDYSATFDDNKCVKGFNTSNRRYGFKTDVIQHYDDAEIAHRLVCKFLDESPSISGIYCTTGITAAICKAINIRQRGDIKVIGTEITEETRACFEAGGLIAALFQDPFQQGRSAFKAMYDYLESAKSDHIPDIQINPEIVVPSNLQYYEQFIKQSI